MAEGVMDDRATEGAGRATEPAPSVVSEALRWAALGRPVFPLVPGEKVPAVSWTTEATTEPAMIHGWWDPEIQIMRPMYGLGLPTGKGLVVIDVDVSRGGEINPSWPATYAVYTRSGGWHLYYHVDREVPNSVDRIAKGVDVRGDGGYVVAAPTPGWRAVNPGAEIVEIPYHFLVAPGRGGAEDWTPFRQAEEAVPEGTRNDYLARFTGFLVRAGLDDFEELLDAVERENERVCSPPMTSSETYQVTRSIWRYRGR